MTITDFKNAVDQQLQRIEENPKVYVEVQQWSHHDGISYTVSFYSNSDKGQAFEINNRTFRSPKSAECTIAQVKAAVDNFIDKAPALEI